MSTQAVARAQMAAHERGATAARRIPRSRALRPARAGCFFFHQATRDRLFKHFGRTRETGYLGILVGPAPCMKKN